MWYKIIKGIKLILVITLAILFMKFLKPNVIELDYEIEKSAYSQDGTFIKKMNYGNNYK